MLQNLYGPGEENGTWCSTVGVYHRLSALELPLAKLCLASWQFLLCVLFLQPAELGISPFVSPHCVDLAFFGPTSVAFLKHTVLASGHMSIPTAVLPNDLVVVFIITGASRPISFYRQT